MNSFGDKKVIFVIGPPGAGKGTQAKLLAKRTGYYHFITSKEGKDYIASHRDDPKTLEQEKNYKKGRLFEPEWLLGVQKERVKEILKKGVLGIIFDGSPRTLFEAENLPAFLSSLVGKDNLFFVVIDVSVYEMKKRAKERLVCNKNENHVASTRLQNVKAGDKCPYNDGGILVKRDLDAEIEERIREYEKRTAPAIDYLKKHYNVFVVNGEQSVEEIHKEIVRALT